MSARPEAPMPLLCELGWHRPEPIARWNDGYYFSKCSRCGRDLVRTAFGQWQLPKGYRVVWQQKPPETRVDIALVPENDDGATAPERETADAGVATAAATELPAAPEPAVPPSVPAQTEAPAAPRVSAEAEAPAAPVQAPPAPPPVVVVVVAEPPARVRGEPVTEEANGAADPVEVGADAPAAVHIQPQEQLPIEDLLQQSNGTGGHEVHEASTIVRAEAAAAAPELPAVPPEPRTAPGEERNELPIEEVLRHLHSTPLPETPPENGAAEGVILFEEAPAPEEPAPEEDLSDTAAEEIAAEDAPAADSPSDEVTDSVEPEEALDEQAPAEQEEPVEDEATSSDVIAEPAEAESEGSVVDAAPGTSPLEEVQESEVPDILQEEAPEPQVEAEARPAPPARAPEPPRPAQPVRRYSSDWDFMAEDEDDSISSFWEESEAAASNVTLAAAAARSAPDVQESVREEAPAPEQPASSEPLAGELAPAAIAEPDHPDVEQEPLSEEVPTPSFAAADERPVEEDAQPQPVPVPVAIQQSDPFAAAPEPQLDAAASLEDTVPVFRPLETSDPPEPPADVVETPPWVDQVEGEGEEEAPRSRTARLVIAGVAAVLILAFIAMLASQPRRVSAPAAVSPNVAAAPAAKPEIAAASNEPVLKQAASKQERPRTAERAPQPNATASLPPLRGRGLAFVTASVLQCRSAPVERSAPVRKLVRGAQVQILAREGEWLSVAHKGRQCWAAARFLSAAEPW